MAEEAGLEGWRVCVGHGLSFEAVIDAASRESMIQ
jgi:hypothetical protein